MVTEYGMSTRLGLQRFGLGIGESYARSTKANYSDDIASEIDDEVRSIVDAAAEEAREILTLHRPTLDRLAERLLEAETLEREELDRIFAELVLDNRDRTPRPVISLDLR